MSQTRYLTEAYNSFVTGCKSDGIWDAIKAACIMAGWDGLAGGLTPIKGAAPTNVNFVAGDWNRKTGLVGNGSTKYLNSNRLGTADSNGSNHLALFVSATSAGDGNYAGVGAFSVNGTTAIGTASSAPTTLYAYNRNGGFASISNGNSLAGLKAISRPNTTSFGTRAGAATTTTTSGAQSGIAQNMAIFAGTASDGTVGSFTNARLSFYSIGENLNLSLLDARVTRLMDDIAFVLNYGLSPLSYNADAINWANRVVDAGATVSSSTLTAVNTFCNAVDAAGIRDRFLRMNLFAGSNLTAALVPLYRSSSYGGAVIGNATDTNTSFVSGDYVEYGETGGIKGDGTTKYLSTGFRTQDFPDVYDTHLAVWNCGGTVSNTYRVIGGFGLSNDQYFIDLRLAAGGGNLARLGGTASFGINSLDESAHSMIASRTSASSAVFYKNATSVATQTTTLTGVTGTSQTLGVFAGLSSTTPSLYSPTRLSGYSIGRGLTAQQATAFHNAWNTFQTAMGRVLPQVSNAEAQNWITRVYAAGGTVSASTASAVNTFCTSIEQAGIRDRFTRLNVFAGSNLTAALVPLYRAAAFNGAVVGNAFDTNNNFVSGDFVETGATGGLKGDGTTKYLNTGFASNALGQTDRHMSVFFDLATSVNNRYWFGTDQSGCGSSFWAIGSSSTTSAEFRCGVPGAGSISASGKVHVLVSGNGNATSYRNGAASTSVSGTAFTAPAQNIYLHALNRCNSPTDYGSCRVQAYSLGLSMTSAQASAFYAALSAFNSALSRS